MGKRRFVLLCIALALCAVLAPVITACFVAAMPLILFVLVESLVRRGVGYLHSIRVRDRRTGDMVEYFYRTKYNHPWCKLTPWHEGAVTYKSFFSDIPVIMVAGAFCPPRLLLHELGHVEQFYRRKNRMGADYEREIILIGYNLSTHETGADQFRDFVLVEFPGEAIGLQLVNGAEIVHRKGGVLGPEYWTPGPMEKAA